MHNINAELQHLGHFRRLFFRAEGCRPPVPRAAAVRSDRSCMEEQAGTLFPAYLGARCFESAAHLEQWIHTPALQGVLLSTSTGERLEPHQLLEREKVLPSHTTPLRRAAVETSNGVHGQSPSARTSYSPAAQQPARTPLPHAAESFTRWRTGEAAPNQRALC